MADKKQKRAPRQPKVYPDEQKIEQQMKPLQDKKKSGKDLTDNETEQLSSLRKELGALRFVRIAKQRGAKAVAMLENIGKLGSAQYVRTDEQVAKIKANLSNALNSAMAKLAPSAKGEAKKAAAFDL